MLDYGSGLGFSDSNGKWDWRIYAKCTNDCGPIVFYGMNREELLPDVNLMDDLVVLTMYGVNMKITQTAGTNIDEFKEFVNQSGQLATLLEEFGKLKTSTLTWSNDEYVHQGLLEDVEQQRVLAECLFKTLQISTKNTDKFKDTYCIETVKKCIELLQKKTSIKNKRKNKI